MLVAGVGELLADAAPMFRNGRAASLAALIVTSLIYSAALWVAITAEMPLTAGLTKVWLVVTLSSWLVLAAAAAIAAACALGLWAADRPRDVPGWVAERGLPRPWPSGEPGRLARALAIGLACGAVGVLALLALRLIAGPASDLAAREGRFYLFVWMTAAATSVALLALAAGQRRLGTGMGAAVVACLTTIAGFLVMNTALGGALDARFAAGVARPAIALAFVATVVLAPLALVPRRAFNGFAATAVAIACAASLVLARDAITPGPVDANVPEEIGHPVAVQVYVTAFAPALLNDYVAIQREAPQLATDLAGVTQVADRFKALLARAEAYDARADEVRAVHLDCIAALRAGVRIYAEIETALRSGDQRAFDRAAAAQAEEQRAWSRWQAGLAALASGA